MVASFLWSDSLLFPGIGKLTQAPKNSSSFLQEILIYIMFSLRSSLVAFNFDF